MERTGTKSSPWELPAAVAWLGLAAAATLMLLRPANPYWLVVPGVVLAFAYPEREGGGWNGYVSVSLNRIADTALLGGIAWSLGRLEGDVAGAAAASATLVASLLSSYVHVRAASLLLAGDGPGAATRRLERGLRLGLIAAGLVRGLVPLLWAAAAFSAVLALARGRAVWREASRV